MNSTIAALVPYVKNGVILTLDVKKGNYHLYKLLLSNYSVLESSLKKAGIKLLNESSYFNSDEEFSLWITYKYGKNEVLPVLDNKTYNCAYYRASKLNMTVKEYLRYLGFKVKEDINFVSMIDIENMSVRKASKITGIPKSTVHRLYKKQKGMM